jgi:hypothetical protein
MNEIDKKIKEVPQDELEVIERYIILLLGVRDSPIPSLLHLEKEMFIFSKINEKVRKFIPFTPHYQGPYSDPLKDVIESPFYFPSAWEIIDKGGKKEIVLTSKGKKIFEELVKMFDKDENFSSILRNLKLIRELYDRLSEEELLILVYFNYPEYTTKSKILESIIRRGEEIAQSLLRKGIITEEKYEEIIKWVNNYRREKYSNS